jgi:hypothetical protein
MLGFLWGVFCVVATARAHVVSQIFGEWKVAKTWEIEVLFDAGYAVPEWREDAQVKAPTREWLVALGESGWAPLRREAELYLRESLQLKSGGKISEWTAEFPDFAKSPPDFPELLNEGAYFRMRIVGTNPLKNDAAILWAEGKRPSLILQMPGKDAGFLTIKPGQVLPLPGTGQERGRPSWVESFRQGFLHVLPSGLDHVLFVMGLFFYQRKWRPLLWQSLAFTLAHTVTLGLAAAGIVKVSGAWVEPAIALSIIVVAMENLLPVRKTGYRVRLVLVFGFGLIHGLGFAGALAAWLKPGEGFLTALMSANLGVEAAQVTLLGAAWCLTLGWSRGMVYQRVRWICCMGIAATGSFWFLERTGVLTIFQR